MAAVLDDSQETSFAKSDGSEPSLGARRFSIDDAFSEGGEDNFEFSTESVRKELARTSQSLHSFTGDGEDDFQDIHIEPSYNDTDTSVSTLDINAPAVSAPVPSSASVPLSPDASTSKTESQEYAGTPFEATSPTKDEITGTNGGAHHSFPSVVIDLSRDPASQVTVFSQSSPEIVQAQSTPSSGSVTAVSNASMRSKDGSTAVTSIPVSQSLPVAAGTSRPQTHRPSKSTGPSALEKVISKTRPTFLPPKPKQEDLQHLADWEAMMKQSREAGK